MRKTLSVSGLKFITIIALATLFMFHETTTTTTTALAHECPCNLRKALMFGQKEAAKLGGEFQIEECMTFDNGIEAEGVEGDCRIELAAEFDPEIGVESRVCEYELQCGVVAIDEPIGGPPEIDLGNDSFVAAFNLTGLTQEQLEACIDTIKSIAKAFFKVECTPE